MIIRMRNWSNVLEVKDICDVNKTWTFYLNPLLGTPVSANHVAASECVKSYRYRSRAWVNVHIKHQNKEQVWSLTEAWLLVPDQSASSLILSSTRRFHQQNCRSLNVFRTTWCKLYRRLCENPRRFLKYSNPLVWYQQPNLGYILKTNKWFTVV